MNRIFGTDGPTRTAIILLTLAGISLLSWPVLALIQAIVGDPDYTSNFMESDPTGSLTDIGMGVLWFGIPVTGVGVIIAAFLEVPKHERHLVRWSVALIGSCAAFGVAALYVAFLLVLYLEPVFAAVFRLD